MTGILLVIILVEFAYICKLERDRAYAIEHLEMIVKAWRAEKEGRILE